MISEVIKNVKESYGHIPYTMKHYIAFMKTQKRVLGKYKYLFHDWDKLGMYIFLPFLGCQRIGQIHQRVQSHHPTYTIGKRKEKRFKPPFIVSWEEAIIDWECARLTKPDKPLDAHGTMEKFYPEYEEEVRPVLKRLGLWRKS